ENMVSQARSLLVRLMGVRNSESTLYRRQSAQSTNSAGAESSATQPYGGEAETDIADFGME
ncbi:TPA: hypothetical protein ACHOZF_005065, partial [Raoultella planticola]